MQGRFVLYGKRSFSAAALWLVGIVVLLAMWEAHGNAQLPDTTPPTIVATATTAPNANGWYRTNVRVKFVCTDAGTGVAFCPPAQTISTEGADQVISGTARDRAGNTASASVTLSIDKTKPVVTATRTPDEPESGWNTTPVTVTFAATDDLSGLAPGTLTAPITITADRTNGIATGRATDLAGNVGVVQMTGINIDQRLPSISVALTPEISGGGYRNAAVTAHFTCKDGRSGVASCPDDQLFENDGVKQVVTGTAVDVAGNSRTISKTLNIDRTAPTITATITPAPNASGWNTAPVSVKFVCKDALSGILSCPAPITVATEGAAQALNVVATDRARNTASPSAVVNIDLMPPTIEIAAPADQSTVSTPTITITGSATDAASGIASVSVAGRAAVVANDGAFTISDVPLVDGANGLTIVATDRVGRTTSQSVSVTYVAPEPEPTPSTSTELMEDPQFDNGISNFSAQDASSAVARSTVAPLEGAASLQVSIAGYGNNLWWFHTFAGGRASRFVVSAHLRSDVASASTFQFCAMVYFDDGSAETSCQPVSGALGDKGVVSAALDIDPTRKLASTNIRMIQERSDPVTFTLDAASALLDIVEMPPPPSDGGGGDGGGSGGGGGGVAACTVPAPGTSGYPGFTYNLPLTRPFISLSHYASVDQSSTAFQRFRAAVDQAVAGDPPYAYTAQNSVLMFRLTNNPVYIDDAITRVDAFVADMEDSINAGGTPAIAGDSYLEVGWYLEALSLTYDYGYDRLTDAQRLRWETLANQAVFNVWHPNEAAWGGVSHPWTGWSICDPGNNYHFSFLRATMLWALATKNMELIDFLQTDKFPPLVAYYADLAGGGTREGTGYGTAIRNLFETFLYWKSSTGEDLAALTTHSKETIDYWVHATVPTLDRFAPIGDLSRSSIPDIFDYHENLVHFATLLNPGTPQAKRGAWWLENNSVHGVQYQFNLYGDLLPIPDSPVAPTSLVYHSTGAGALFARSSWDADASWLAVQAGKYDQSHAHQDQGSFTFFRRDWLAVTSNIWSQSGIHQETDVHNVIRFERADGSIIGQSPSDTLASTMNVTSSNGTVTVDTDLSNAYYRNANLVQAWTRHFEFFGHSVRIGDSCTVASGVKAIFQLHVPVLPVVQQDGSIVAGNLTIVPLLAMNVTIHQMPSPEFDRGYRLEFTNPLGCQFLLELHGQ